MPDTPEPREEDWSNFVLFVTNNTKDLPSPILHSAAMDLINRCAPTVGGYQDKVTGHLSNRDMDIVIKDVYITHPEDMCITLSNFRIDDKSLICDIACMSDDVFSAISANPVHTLRMRSLVIADSKTNRPTEQEIITWYFLNE